MLHKDYDRKGSVEKKTVVVNLKELGAKVNWLTVNCESYSNSDSDSVIVETRPLVREGAPHWETATVWQ
jgi:hypothetical protein